MTDQDIAQGILALAKRRKLTPREIKALRRMVYNEEVKGRTKAEAKKALYQHDVNRWTCHS